MKYIFIDTNLFIEAVTSNEGESILNSFFKQLNKKGVTFVLPEVIKMEIITQYNYWKEGVIDSIKTNLETKKILGINEALTEENKSRKKQKGETESEKIDSVIEPHRKQMIKKIESRYKSISKQIEQIFKHKNTEIINLTDQILLAGIKRSVLKKSPYTRKDPFIKPDKNENTHTKDIDCIAFETLATFCKKNSVGRKKNILVMCVSDKDYFSTDGDLHADLKKDITMESKFYKVIMEMLNKEFNAKIGFKKTRKIKKSKDEIGSLVGSDGGLAEGLKIITP